MAFPNKYPSQCCECGSEIPAYKGFGARGPKGGSKWVFYHAEGDCVERNTSRIAFDNFQQAVCDAVQCGVDGPHILVKARAGSGKTTVKCQSIGDLYESDSDLNIITLAFGAEDGKRLRAKLPPGVQGSSTHSYCSSIVREHFGLSGKDFNKSKDFEIIEMVVGCDDHYEAMRQFVTDLITKAKADAIRHDDIDGIVALDESYELAIPEDQLGAAARKASEVLKESLDIKKWGYNYDDMLWLVVVLGLDVPAVDFIGVDECQDWNECQLQILSKFIAKGARVLAVGDPEQSLYAFRGARHDAFDRVKAILTDSDRGCDEFTMPISYRSSQAVIRLAQTIVSDIQARPDAPMGAVSFDMPLGDAIEYADSGDLMICRTNSPIVKIARMLIKTNRSFYMRGGIQEAAILKWYVRLWARGGNQDGIAVEDVGDMVDRGQRWVDDRSKKCSGYKLAEHKDRLEVVQLISESCFTVKDVLKAIDKTFKQPQTDDCLILSTIHRAKGSEAQRVFHVEPKLVPHPKAKTQEQQKQESNAKYVCITRAIDEYHECVGETAGMTLAEAA